MRDRWVVVAIGCVGVVGYLIAGGGAPTVYDYYGRLAEAFVHGRYWLTEDPPWLNELVSCGDGRWCVAYPPLPAILAIPLIWAGTANAQGAVAPICGGASAGVLYAALRAYGAPRAIAIYVAYDLMRWGSVTDAGYARLAEGDFFFDHGLFSLAYLPRHLYAIVMEPPDLVPNVWYFLRPRFIGMSLFLTTPAFLFVFAGLQDVRRSVAVAAAALAAGLALLPDVTHGTVGFAQFGYRFSIDAQPFLVALALGGDALRAGVWRSRPSILFLVATGLAILINVYATIAIIRYGFWQ